MGLGEFAKILTLLELSLIAYTIGYILIIKKDIFDPRLYVLYGIFHWLIVGQLYFVFSIDEYFGFEAYEPSAFSDREVMLGSAFVLVCTFLFLLGYFCLGFQRSGCRSSASRISFDIDKRLLLGIGANIRCAAFVIWFVTILMILLIDKRLISIPVVFSLPLGYLLPAASVYMVFIIYCHVFSIARISLFELLLLIFSLGVIAAVTNIVLIYPLIVACVLFGGRLVPGQSRLKISLLVLLAPFVVLFAMAIQLAGKIYRRVLNVGVDINISNFYYDDSYGRAFERAMVTLDSFNTESFAVLLQTMRSYVNPEVYLYGRSLLSAFPLFKLSGGESFQSFGRLFALQVLGVSPESNTAMAVTPMAEIAANFSYAGAAFFYFMLGLFCFYAYSKFQRSKSLTSVAVYLVLLVWLFLQQRGDFLNGNMYPAYVVLGVFILARIFGRKSMSRTYEKKYLVESKLSREGAN